MNFDKMHLLISKAQTVAIASHHRPDGDCVGSSLALRLALLGMGKKKADVYIDDELHEKMSYMKDFEDISRPTDIENKDYDLFIILDCNCDERLGEAVKLREHAKSVLCVDHHQKNRVEANECVVNEGAASTGEILFAYFREHKIEITKDMAACLYTSLATDTGCFLYANTTDVTHTVAAELMKIGVNSNEINYLNFKMYDFRIIDALAYVYRNVKMHADKRIATIYIPYRFMRKFNLSGETDRMKNIVSEASGVVVGAFISEEEKGKFHVSLRSHDTIDVGAVAARFSGGGHKNASGFSYEGSYRDLERKLLADLKKTI